MNYTDRYFKILIRLSDEFKLMKIQEDLEKNTTLPDNAPIVDTVDALYCIKDYKTIISYQEMYPPEVDFDSIMDKGFNCTLVTIKIDNILESVLCSWPVKKFEEKLNQHVNKIEENPA